MRSIRGISGRGLIAQRQAVDQFEVLFLNRIGFRLGDGRLAEQVDGESERFFPQAHDRLHGFGNVRPGNETAGEVLRVPFGGPGQQPAAEAALGEQLHRIAQPPGDGVAGRSQVFAQMAGNCRRIVQARQSIDKAKKLDLERFGAHGPVHQQLIDPGGRERLRALPLDAGEDFPSVGDGSPFEFAGRHHVAFLLRLRP